MNIDYSFISPEEGVSDFGIVNYNGKPVFFKRMPKMSFFKQPLVKLNSNIIEFVFNRMPLRKPIIITKNHNKLMNQEHKVWNLWKDNGVRVVDLLNYNEDGLFYKFLEGSLSFKQSLESQTYQKSFDSFIEQYSKLRELAQKYDNPMFLHSDSLLKNYLDYNGKCYPIDSSYEFRQDMNLKSIDSAVNLTTLMSITELKTNDENKIAYIKKFGKCLSEEDIDSMSSIDLKCAWYFEKFLDFREEFVYRIKGREKMKIFESDRNVLSIFEDIKEYLY